VGDLDYYETFDLDLQATLTLLMKKNFNY